MCWSPSLSWGSVSTTLVARPLDRSGFKDLAATDMPRKLIVLCAFATLVAAACVAGMAAASYSPFRSVSLAAIAILVIVLPGLIFLRSVNRDVREVTDAA